MDRLEAPQRMKDLLLGVHVVVNTLNLDFSRRRLADYVLLKCVHHEQHDYFSPFNQSDHRFLRLSLQLPSSLLKLPNDCSGGRGD